MKLRLILFFAIGFLCSNNFASAQSKEASFLLDTCIAIMKSNAFNADKMDWNKLRQEAFAKAAGINDAYQLGPAIRYLYEALYDFHGRLYYKDSLFQWAHNNPAISDSIMNEWRKGVTLHPYILDKKIGYLRIPSMPYPAKKDADKHAQQLNDTLCYLLNQNIKGLILDARLDGGGSMYPMMLGLEQLLKPGQLGFFVHKKREYWYIKENNFLLDTNVLASIHPVCNINAQNLPVVILTGSGTGSSGEFLLMAFKSRKNTILLGEPTAGWVTSVAGFPVNNTTHIMLSTGYGADMNGKIYTDALQPDILMHATDKFNNIGNDEKIIAAISWLQHH